MEVRCKIIQEHLDGIVSPIFLFYLLKSQILKHKKKLLFQKKTYSERNLATSVKIL